MACKLFLSLLASVALASSSWATSIPLTSAINGGQVVPPTLSPAFGTGVFTLDDVLHTLDVAAVITSVLLLGPETTTQLHVGAVGTNGPAVADLSTGALKTGVLDLTLLAACSTVTDCENDIKGGLWYFLTSSDALPEGEIRGQLNPVNAVPEPLRWIMLTMGLSGLAIARLRPA